MYQEIRDYRELQVRMNELIGAGSVFACSLIDIDDFHETRLELSKEERIQLIFNSLFSMNDHEMYYVGLDEFAILSLRYQLEDLFVLLMEGKQHFEKDVQMTFSAGLAQFPDHGDSPVDLLRHLEESLFKAKQNGKNKIGLEQERKMKLKSNYYTLTQLERLSQVSKLLNRSEASLLRESLDELLRKYEK
ncbi:hypothetical protein [Paenibacillus sp. FSL P2-0173]|uniref:hypothetical protein n=1 Tax=Paenibacillus sp. FSL P2-0173 TaxID=2921627 RepID=UPI0030F71C0C